MFSVVLPCFNESRHGYLPRILENLAHQTGEKELIAAVSPSQDDTLSILQQYPAVKVIETEATNRAQRLNAGIAASQGAFVLLHHPATLLPEKIALQQAQKILAESVWGGFIHSFDLAHPLLRFTSWYSTRVRSRQQGVLYLDHCIFVRREALLAVGGVPDMDIFEDTALSIALRDGARAKGQTATPAIAPSSVVTSARRFRSRGIYRQALVNQILKGLYHAGFDPKKMNWLYERKSQINVNYAEQQTALKKGE